MWPTLSDCLPDGGFACEQKRLRRVDEGLDFGNRAVRLDMLGEKARVALRLPPA